MQHYCSVTVFKFHENMVQPLWSWVGESKIEAANSSQWNDLCPSKFVVLAPPNMVIQIVDEWDDANLITLTNQRTQSSGVIIAGGNKNFMILTPSRKKREWFQDLAPLLWNSLRTIVALLQSQESHSFSKVSYQNLLVRDCPTAFSSHSNPQEGYHFFSGRNQAWLIAYCSSGMTSLILPRSVIPFSFYYLCGLSNDASLRLLGSMESSPIQECDDGNTSEETWSSLPILLIWMIKDRLDFFSNVRLAAVCQNWWLASERYPNKLHSAKDGLPWIRTSSRNSDGSRVVKYMSVSSGETYTVNVPRLFSTSTLCSKQGWLLFQLRRSSASGITPPHSIFLYNHFTSTRIEMPDVEETGLHYVGSFSTIEGYPNCVVLIWHTGFHGPQIKIAYPGDKVWTEHSDIARGCRLDGFTTTAIVGDHVYAFDLSARMFIYNTKTRVWKILLNFDKTGRHFMLESEGKIMKLSWNSISGLTNFFRYNHTDFAWEKLSNDDVKDISWFLSGRSVHSCFSAKEKGGSKVYHIDCMHRSRFFQYCTARVHDLGDGSVQTLFPELCSSACWEDMG